MIPELYPDRWKGESKHLQKNTANRFFLHKLSLMINIFSKKRIYAHDLMKSNFIQNNVMLMKR